MTWNALLNVVIVAAVVILVIVRRMTWRPVTVSGRESTTMPLILCGVGVLQLKDVVTAHTSAADLGLLAAGVLVSIVVGALIGRITELRTVGGVLQQRMGWLALGVWLAYVLIRILLAGAGHLLGAAMMSSGGTLMLSLGANLLVQSLVVASRTASGTKGSVGSQAR